MTGVGWWREESFIPLVHLFNLNPSTPPTATAQAHPQTPEWQRSPPPPPPPPQYTNNPIFAYFFSNTKCSVVPVSPLPSPSQGYGVESGRPSGNVSKDLVKRCNLHSSMVLKALNVEYVFVCVCVRACVHACCVHVVAKNTHVVSCMLSCDQLYAVM